MTTLEHCLLMQKLEKKEKDYSMNKGEVNNMRTVNFSICQLNDVIELTESNIAFLQWLKEHEYLNELAEFEILEKNN